MASPPPNYYRVLEISESATAQQIRDAYKRAALKTHPDRVASDSPERQSRTRKFQIVNDAYFTLSDAKRRREYDATRGMFSGASGQSKSSNAGAYPDPFEGEDWGEMPAGSGSGPGAARGAFSWAWNYFTGGSNSQSSQQERERAEREQFGDVFEEMLREEGMAQNAEQQGKGGKFWSVAGGVSGGVLGFILANFPGLMAGAVAGNRLGAVRDVKGKSVYEVFQTLPQSERAQLLTQLAARVFSKAMGV